MRRIPLILSLLLWTLTLPLASRAQDADKPAESAKSAEATPSFYHLVFVVQEVDAGGKPVNSRTYTTTVSTDKHFWGQIRTGSRIPIATGASSSSDAKGSDYTQIQYIDVGVNFDLGRVIEVGRQLSLDLTADVSSLADTIDSTTHRPVIRQNKWRASVIIPIGKATTIFSSDELDSKGSLQVTVTATPLQ